MRRKSVEMVERRFATSASVAQESPQPPEGRASTPCAPPKVAKPEHLKLFPPIAERTECAPYHRGGFGNTLSRCARFLAALLLLLSPVMASRVGAEQIIEADICIYGGTAGGVAAAVQVARMGKRAVIAEFGNHL